MKYMTLLNILFMGCGFLTSHLFPHIVVHAKHLIFVDREKIEKVNYDNSIFPKNFVSKRKVTALASLTQLISSVKTTPIHVNIKNTDQISEICDKYSVDFIFVTFDNIQSRLLVRDFAIKSNIPALFMGVTESFIYIDWSQNLVIPDTKEKIKKAMEEIERIRDVCTRLEFRSLGAIAAGFAYHSFYRWLTNNEMHMYNISVKNIINSTTKQR